MKKAISLVIITLIIFGGSRLTNAQDDQLKGLTSCVDETLNVKHVCNKDWQMQSADDAILIVVSVEPDVTMIIAKIDSKIKFLSQLTTSFLQDKERYKDGFRTEKVKLKNLDAVKVKAFAKGDANKRLLDYYFIKDQSLYGILFSVNPKEEMDNYKFLFKHTIDNLEFL